MPVIGFQKYGTIGGSTDFSLYLLIDYGNFHIKISSIPAFCIFDKTIKIGIVF
jgi:hypothetical protein